MVKVVVLAAAELASPPGSPPWSLLASSSVGLPLAHGAPLGSRAELRPLGPRSTARPKTVGFGACWPSRHSTYTANMTACWRAGFQGARQQVCHGKGGKGGKRMAVLVPCVQPEAATMRATGAASMRATRGFHHVCQRLPPYVSPGLLRPGDVGTARVGTQHRRRGGRAVHRTYSRLKGHREKGKGPSCWCHLTTPHNPGLLAADPPGSWLRYALGASCRVAQSRAPVSTTPYLERDCGAVVWAVRPGRSRRF